MRVSRPSSSRVCSALAHVCRACPSSWHSEVMDGVGMPGGKVPSAICRRSRAARRTYARGSDSSLIDTLAPYSIGNIANRNASTLVEIRRVAQVGVNVGKRGAANGRADTIPGQIMILYTWTAMSGSTSESIALGITDDRGRAMRAGEESLGSGLAIVVIIEAVRPAMIAATLAPCYVPTGVGWLGQCTRAGDVTWRRFMVRAESDEPIAAGRMEP